MYPCLDVVPVASGGMPSVSRRLARPGGVAGPLGYWPIPYIPLVCEMAQWSRFSRGE